MQVLFWVPSVVQAHAHQRRDGGWGLPESVSVAETLKPLQELNDETELEELKALMATSMVQNI